MRYDVDKQKGMLCVVCQKSQRRDLGQAIKIFTMMRQGAAGSETISITFYYLSILVNMCL